MKKILLLLSLSIIPFTILFGQSEEATITGEIYDQESQTVPNASIAVYDSSKSEIVTGASSDSSGEFSIDVDPGNYVLEITFISFTPHTQAVEVNSGETLDIGEIVMEPTSETMEELVVEGEKSQMQMNFDKRVFQVGEDITSLGGSAINVLDNVPSIATDIDGNISLRGNESVRVLINGKPSSMVSDDVDALRSIPANMIAEVEIITNPSSKYAAEGSAGIINIILKKDRDRGLNGSVSVGTGIPQDHEVSTSLNYRTGAVNWFLGGSLDYRSDPESGSSFQRFAGPDTSYMYREATDATESEVDGNLRFGADIYFGEEHTLTASTYINIEDERNREDITYTDMNYSEGSFHGDVIEQVLRENDEQGNERDLDFNLDYENKFDGDEHKLVADASFDMSRGKEHSDIEESVIEGNEEPLFQRTEDGEEETDLRFNAEYIRPLGENGKLETGVRSDMEWADNSFFVEQQQNETWEPLPAYNDNFIYFENVNALYAIVGSELGSFSGQVGLRAENTRIRTEIKGTGAVNDQNYLNLFPSVFLNYEFNDQQSVQISYSRRLSRPWSRMLLPFTDFSDSRSQFTGNPNLTPEFSNSYEAGYLHYWNTGSIMTSVYYRHRTDVIERITEQDQGVIRRFPINLATEKAWGIEFSADQEIANSLTLTGNANLYRSDSEGSYGDQLFSSETENFQARMRLRWEISESWNYQASMRYRGPRETTQGRRAGNTMMDSGISFEMMDGKALLSLNVRDLLNSRNFNYTVTTDGNPNTDFYSQRQFSWSSRSFSLNFRYFFGRDQERRDSGGPPGGDGGGGFEGEQY